MSIENISIIGTGIFGEDSQNGGIVDNGIFQDSSTNSGTVSTASFSGTSINSGTVSIATFEESSLNSGSITESASFSDTTVNTGSISGTVTFSGSASNTGGTIEGNVVFSDTTVNTGTVSEAVFISSSSNTGVITLSAYFADTSINSGTVEGDAIFSDSTTNTGTIEGNAQIAATADNSSGTVSGSVTVYVQPDGYFANGYYSGGVKTAPPNYDTVVYQVGNVWYKYDASGNGNLATGNYSDGTSMFTFNNGVKGAAYVPEFLPDGTFIRTENNPNPYTGTGANNNTNGTVDVVADGNGGERYGDYYYPAINAVTFGQINDTITISEISQSFDNGDIDILSDGNGGYYQSNSYNIPSQGYIFTTDGTNNYVADGSGGYYSCLVSGTFIRTDIIYISIVGAEGNYEVGNVGITADGTCGEIQGTPSYNPNGILLTNQGGYNYYTDGAGSYYSCLVSGTFIRTDIINIIIPEAGNQSFQVGTVDITADGTCGEIQGTPSYVSNGTLLITYGDINYYSDGAGSYYTEPAA